MTAFPLGENSSDDIRGVLSDAVLFIFMALLIGECSGEDPALFLISNSV
jgi:hypothetical protein